jgi:thiol-disulfide isomerase/thioredoxin
VQKPPAELPGEAYKESVRPLEVVRSSMENWSDAEVGALAVGIRKAGEACAQGRAETYTGDDLFDFARLCSLGQDWNGAETAAQSYITGGAEGHRAQAFALTLTAQVHLNGMDDAVKTANEMLAALQYDAEVAYALRYLKDNLEKAGNPAAVTLAMHEHLTLVKALATGKALAATHGDAVIGLGALFESGAELAFLQRYSGDERGAATTMGELEGALGNPATLSWEDRTRIEGIRTQYALLGARLPQIEIKRALFSKTAKMQIGPDFGVATVLVLFPDWCTQCRHMMKTVTQFAAVNGDVPIHAYGLMFPDEAKQGVTSPHDDDLKDVQGTATMLVTPSAAKSFGATDYPLAIVLDAEGLVRNVGVISADAFDGDSYMGKLIKQMANQDDVRPKAE